MCTPAHSINPGAVQLRVSLQEGSAKARSIEIRHTLTQLPSVKLVYVKGHQDRDRAYNSLDLLAKLNVDADTKARAYQEQFRQARPYALMTKHTGAYLVYPEGTITAKYRKAVRRRATSTPLRTCLTIAQWT